MATPVSPAWVRDQLPNIAENAELDEFGVGRIVDRLCTQIETTEVPFTISLSGTWGVGKSTIASAVARRLRSRGIAACYIDAWNEDVDGIRRRLVVEVGAQMLLGQRGHIRTDDEWADLVSDTGAAREGVAAFLDSEVRTSIAWQTVAEAEFRWPRRLPQAVAVLLVVAGISALLIWLTAMQDSESPWIAPFTSLLATAVGFLIFSSGLGIRVPTETRATAPATEAVHTAQRFSQVVTGDLSSLPDDIDRPAATPARVLVVVDNIDRLTGEEAITALSSMRALVEVPHSRCVFLVPVDRGALLRHLDVKLPSQADGPSSEGASAAEDFLQKLFALDVPLTSPERYDLISFADRTARRLFGSHADAPTVEYVAQIAASAAGTSPRVVQRVLNGAANRRAILAEEPDDGGSVSPPLTTLVFVEGLVQLFPELVSQLVAAPRALVDLRNDVSSSVTSHDVELMLIESEIFLRGESAVLARYLLANSEIDMSAAELLTSISLRRDRFWRDIEHGPEIEEAMRAGDAGATEGLLPGSSSPERRAAVVRCIEFIERRAQRYPRDAFNNLNALVDSVSDEMDWSRLRETALQVVAISDGRQLPALRPEVGSRVLAKATGANARRARARLVALLTEPVSKDVDHLLRLIKASVSELTDDEVASVRQALPGFSDDETASLFEPTTAVRVVEGDLAQAYLDRIPTWAPSSDAETQQLTRTAAERLRFAKRAGWSRVSGIDAVAEHARAQFAASRPSEDALVTFRSILAFLREFGTLAANGPLAIDLANASFFSDAVRLPVVDESQRAGVIGRIDPWITSGDLSTVTSFIRNRVKSLDRYKSTFRSQLADRWAASGEPEALQGLLDVSDTALATDKVVALPASIRLTRAAELVVALGRREDKESVRAVRDRMVAESPLGSSLDGLGSFAKTVQEAGADPAPLGNLLSSHAMGVDASTFHSFMTQLADVQDQAPRIARAAADVVTGKAIALGIASLEEALTIVRASHRRNDPARVLSGAIRRGPERADVVADALGPVRGKLHGDSSVRLALVDRASAVAPAASPEVARYLQEAAKWDPPTGDEARAHDEALERIAGTHPDLIDTVAELKIT